jgi:hypothetical protein
MDIVLVCLLYVKLIVSFVSFQGFICWLLLVGLFIGTLRGRTLSNILDRLKQSFISFILGLVFALSGHLSRNHLLLELIVLVELLRSRVRSL